MEGDRGCGQRQVGFKGAGGGRVGPFSARRVRIGDDGHLGGISDDFGQAMVRI